MGTIRPKPMKPIDDSLAADDPRAPAPWTFPTRSTLSPRLYWILLALCFLLGGYLRLIPKEQFTGVGWDEHFYTVYVEDLSKHGFTNYPLYCQYYLERQTKDDKAILPPTRFLFIAAASLWKDATGIEAARALIHVSFFFSMLALAATAGFARRIGGDGVAIVTTALMSATMNQIHQTHHAMIDGFFTFWCLLGLWGLWENLAQPGRRVWLWIYGISLAAMVLTKENSFFVVCAFCGLIVSNRWIRFGTVQPSLLIATVLGPLIGFLLLLILAGGPGVFFEMYRLLVEKSKVLPYAVLTGDGPWYRYLFDLVLISPLIMLLAIGRSFQMRAEDKASIFLLAFIGITFAIMANIKYGINLRYATIWDMPLRFLAAVMLLQLGARFGRYATLASVVLVLGLTAFEANQFYIFCVHNKAYSLVDPELLRAVKILKP